MEHFAGKSSKLLYMKTLATVRCDILSYVATSLAIKPEVLVGYGLKTLLSFCHVTY